MLYIKYYFINILSLNFLKHIPSMGCLTNCKVFSYFTTYFSQKMCAAEQLIRNLIIDYDRNNTTNQQVNTSVYIPLNLSYVQFAPVQNSLPLFQSIHNMPLAAYIPNN